jgi:hypothetical protein
MGSPGLKLLELNPAGAPGVGAKPMPGAGAGALPPLLTQFLPPVKQASRKMTTTSSTTTPTTMICMRKFCHHIFLRSCVPWRWNLAACRAPKQEQQQNTHSGSDAQHPK